MKRYVALLVPFAIFACLLLSCGYAGSYDDGYEDGYEYGYDEGWDDGFNDGYYEGISEAQHDVASSVEDDLFFLSRDIKDEYGMYPDEALQILSNYADVPDEVDEDDLKEAIWAIYTYYYKSHEIICGIEDYSID